MVLGVHGQPVLVGVLRDAAGQGPGGERPVVFEAQVPVQAPRGCSWTTKRGAAAFFARRPGGSEVFSKSRFPR